MARLRLIVVLGWSELAATNAPVANEPVEAVFRMNKNPILPTRITLFFPPLLYPKIFPLLPTFYLPPPTYHLPTPTPLTPSLELQRRQVGASLEQGSLEGSLRGEFGVGAWSG
jgi:hypothetical protein